MTDTINKSRRRFVKLAVAGGTGLTLGVYLGLCGEKKKGLGKAWKHGPESWVPNAWIRINTNGRTTVRIQYTEMGQGVTTGLATLVAEELDVEWSSVDFEFAPCHPVYANPLFGVQGTGGSTATLGSWEPLRQAGAAARQMLITAAAAEWAVAASECRAERGTVLHPASGRSLAYGELVPAASLLEPPEDPPLKRAGTYRLIGTDVPRLDVPAKINGSARFGVDVRVEGMLGATVIHPPVFGDGVQSFDAERALAMPGVRDVRVINSGVAVVADSCGRALAAADAVKVEWDSRGDPTLSTVRLWDEWAELADTSEAKELHAEGDAAVALGRAAKTLDAEYRLPFQAHAPSEPICCTAHVEKNRARVWCGTQGQSDAQEITARLTGLGYSEVEIHTTLAGGAFGRRTHHDFLVETVGLSLALGAPVQVVWSREEDITHDFYRPASLHRIRGGLDEDGRPIAWTHRIVGPDHMPGAFAGWIPAGMPYFMPRGARNLLGKAGGALVSSLAGGVGLKGGAAPLDYAIPDVRLDCVQVETSVPVGFWRGVSDSSNAFVKEGFFDELAAAAGRDPVELRLALLADNPRLRRVLERAAKEAAWHDPLPPDRHRGVALHTFHGTHVAMVAEVSIEDSIRVHRVVCSVDCGRVINPRIVRTQIAGALIFGLTAALKSRITIAGGRVEQSNYDDFPILTMAETPIIEVHSLDSDQPPNGIGEAGVPPIAPAVANAVFAGTGQRLRELPLALA